MNPKAKGIIQIIFGIIFLLIGLINFFNTLSIINLQTGGDAFNQGQAAGKALAPLLILFISGWLLYAGFKNRRKNSSLKQQSSKS